jgi:hypothetical protein
LDDLGIWKLDDDMSIDWSHPSKDDLSQYNHDDFQSYLGNCDAYPFGNSNLLYDEYLQPPSCSNFNGHKVVANPEKSETHTTEKQFFILGIFQGFADEEATCFECGKYYFSIPELVPFLISPSLGNHRIFLGSLISSQPSRSRGILSEDEEESIYM